jgi:hypothetical protein
VPEVYGSGLYSKGEAESRLQPRLGCGQSGEPSKCTLNRFRPWSAEPFATVELHKWSFLTRCLSTGRFLYPIFVQFDE